MFRIIFDTDCSKFIVQLQCFLVLWKTCSRTVTGEDGSAIVPFVFDNYDEAVAWIRQRGLHRVYAEQKTPLEYHVQMGTGGVRS